MNQLDFKKGRMSAVISGEAEVVFGAIKEVFRRSAGKGLVKTLKPIFTHGLGMILGLVAW